jgi:cytochrome c biogenesis protein CcmG/thiol:disulfide interchange protein DsbE
VSDPSTDRFKVRLAATAALLVVAGLVALLAFGLRTRGTEDELRSALEEGSSAPAPEFELSILEAGDVPRGLEPRLREAGADGALSLEELRGTPLVLNFWASWCEPCRAEAPVLQRGWERDGARGVLYLGLDMQDLTDDAEDFLAEFDITYPTIRDPGREVADAYGLTGIPETFFIDSRSRVVGQVIGVLDARQLEVGAQAARDGRVIGLLVGGEQRAPR